VPPVLVTARRSCPLQSAAMDPAPVPRALQAARPRRSSTATQCDMMVFTVEDMASNFSNGCRRKSGRPENSRGAFEQLDPRCDGDIRKFVVRVARRSGLPTQVIEPFVDASYRLQQQFSEDLEAMK